MAPSKKASAANKISASKSTPSKPTKKTPVKTSTPKSSDYRVTKPGTPTKQATARKVATLAKAADAIKPCKSGQSAKTSKSINKIEDLDGDSLAFEEVQINSAPPTIAQGPSTLFHRLPGELRNRIYRYIGLRGSRIQLAGHKEPALATAIPDLRDEIHSIFFAENALSVSVYSEFKVHDSEPQTYRVAPRGGRFGAGNVAVDPDSWVKTVRPDVMLARRICFSIHEMGGYPIADFFVSVRRDKDTGAQIPRGALHVKGTTKKATRIATAPMADLARHVVKCAGEKAGFMGFSWEQLVLISLSFQSVKYAKEVLAKKAAREKREKQQAKQQESSSKK